MNIENKELDELSSKDLGQLAEALFQYEAICKNLIISKPFGDNSKYDFIVDNSKTLFKVQVKSTCTKRDNGGYQIKASYGSKTAKTKYTKEDIDILAVLVTDLKIWYFVPVKELSSPVIDVFPERKNSKGKYEKFKDNWNIFRT